MPNPKKPPPDLSTVDNELFTKNLFSFMAASYAFMENLSGSQDPNHPAEVIASEEDKQKRIQELKEKIAEKEQELAVLISEQQRQKIIEQIKVKITTKEKELEFLSQEMDSIKNSVVYSATSPTSAKCQNYPQPTHHQQQQHVVQSTNCQNLHKEAPRVGPPPLQRCQYYPQPNQNPQPEYVAQPRCQNFEKRAPVPRNQGWCNLPMPKAMQPSPVKPPFQTAQPRRSSQTPAQYPTKPPNIRQKVTAPPYQNSKTQKFDTTYTHAYTPTSPEPSEPSYAETTYVPGSLPSYEPEVATYTSGSTDVYGSGSDPSTVTKSTFSSQPTTIVSCPAETIETNQSPTIASSRPTPGSYGTNYTLSFSDVDSFKSAPVYNDDFDTATVDYNNSSVGTDCDCD